MHGLKVGRAVLAFWLLTLAYVGLLFWLDRGKGLLSGFDRLYLFFPTLMLFAFAALVARYARWYWLLARAGAAAAVRPMLGFIAYLAGFAFTATPGKVGELLRIRYFQPMGVAPERVVSAFVFERVFDLLVVLCLAGIAAANFGVFPVAAGFVALVLFLVFLLAKHPDRVLHFARYLERRHLRRLARLAEVFAHGFANTRVWLTPLDFLVSAAAGFIAWGLTAYAFVLLLGQLALDVPALLAFSIYPVAMLAGAASMLPGGIGTTEAVLIALLSTQKVGLADATLAAIGIRLATLWFAILLGLLSMLVLEFMAKPGASTKASPVAVR